MYGKPAGAHACRSEARWVSHHTAGSNHTPCILLHVPCSRRMKPIGPTTMLAVPGAALTSPSTLLAALARTPFAAPGAIGSPLPEDAPFEATAPMIATDVC